jgi:hypothetical protein
MDRQYDMTKWKATKTQIMIYNTLNIKQKRKHEPATKQIGVSKDEPNIVFTRKS